MPSLSFRRREWHSLPDLSNLPSNIVRRYEQQQQQQQQKKSLLKVVILTGVVLLFGQLQTCWKITASPEKLAVPTKSVDAPNHTASVVVHNATATPATTTTRDLLVQPGDFIYTEGDWDGAPIVLEKYKLIFFTSAKVGCTTWKQLFRRMMRKRNWKTEEWITFLPWNPKFNGLKYLYHYDQEKASRMLTDPTWTKAIFVRDPKVRFVSAYLDKVVTHHSFINRKCCPDNWTCQDKVRESVSNFITLAQTCHDAHWDPQSGRMEEKYWPYINYVGHMENLEHDAEALLRKVGAWDRYGASGWGPNGTDHVFQASAGGIGRQHATRAQDKLKKYLTPTDEKMLDEWYGSDYAHPVMNITPMQIFEEEPSQKAEM